MKPLKYDNGSPIIKMPAELESGNYRINDTQKKLHWDAYQERWCKNEKDNQGKYSGWIRPLDPQPTNIKFVQRISERELYDK